jgi:hypothetical protein
MRTLDAACKDQNNSLFKAARHVMERQSETVGYIHDRKSGSVVKYMTPGTRKSGDANTSDGNS